jgi:hypothetical protein
MNAIIYREHIEPHQPHAKQHRPAKRICATPIQRHTAPYSAVNRPKPGKAGQNRGIPRITLTYRVLPEIWGAYILFSLRTKIFCYSPRFVIDKAKPSRTCTCIYRQACRYRHDVGRRTARPAGPSAGKFPGQ